jgi:hypothetical protein
VAFGVGMMIVVLIALKLLSGTTAEAQPLVLPTRLPDVAMPEITVGDPSVGSAEGTVYPATNVQFGHLVVVNEYPFQCIKLRRDGTYIDYYQPNIVYMGPLEYGRAEWLALDAATRQRAVQICEEAFG